MALGLGLILQFALPVSQPPPEGVLTAMRVPRLIAPPPPVDRPAILAAPVFSPDRKPGADADAAPGASMLDGYAALGVAIGRGLAAGVVKSPDGASRTLRLGADLEGWRLIALDRTKLTFQKNDARHVLTVGAPALQAGGPGAGSANPSQAGSADQ